MKPKLINRNLFFRQNFPISVTRHDRRPWYEFPRSVLDAVAGDAEQDRPADRGGRRWRRHTVCHHFTVLRAFSYGQLFE